MSAQTDTATEQVVKYRWQILGHPASGLPFKYKVWRPTANTLNANPNYSGDAETREDAMTAINEKVNEWEVERLHQETIEEGVIEQPKSFDGATIPDSLPENWENQ